MAAPAAAALALTLTLALALALALALTLALAIALALAAPALAIFAATAGSLALAGAASLTARSGSILKWHGYYLPSLVCFKLSVRCFHVLPVEPGLQLGQAPPQGLVFGQ